jgi:hypothetical protein
MEGFERWVPYLRDMFAMMAQMRDEAGERLFSHLDDPATVDAIGKLFINPPADFIAIIDRPDYEDFHVLRDAYWWVIHRSHPAMH